MGKIFSLILSWGIDKVLKLAGVIGGLLGLWWLARSRDKAKAEAKAYKNAFEVQKRNQEIRREEEREVERAEEAVESGDADAIAREYDRVRQYAQDKS